MELLSRKFWISTISKTPCASRSEKQPNTQGGCLTAILSSTSSGFKVLLMSLRVVLAAADPPMLLSGKQQAVASLNFRLLPFRRIKVYCQTGPKHGLSKSLRREDRGIALRPEHGSTGDLFRA